MAENRTQKEIDIGLSQRSKSDLQQLQRVLKESSKTVKTMVSDMKKLQDLMKADRLNAIAQTTGGTGAFRRGSAVREQISADRTSAMGSPTGQQNAVAKEQIRLMKEGATLNREELRFRRGMLTNYSQEVGMIRQIRTVKQAKNRMDAIGARMGQDRQAGATQEVATGRRFLRVYEQRIAKLRNIAQLEARAAATAARRNTQLAAPRTRDLPVARAKAEVGRQNTQERLFGDGGAGLMKVQMGLMANYAALNLVTRSFREAIRFSVEFDDSLRNLQAITVLSHGGLAELETTLIGVANETKFSAVELANAAVVLGQAGLSIEQVKSSISSVALLATATGTDLAKAVDIATATLGVFNMEASEMGRVADVMTAAVNNSKLNMEKLTLGLQYAGNIASQSGVTFDELTASFGAMANAGIRSGSTLGTGMRQVLISLQKPSKEFKATLDRLGLSLFDVDLRSKGLYGAMKNLRDAGFTSADAIRSFEVRAAAAFNALSGNLGAMLELEKGFIDSAAAARANETQMQSLSNQSKRFSANLGAVVTIGIKPMVLATRDLTQWLGDQMAIFKDYPEVLRTVTVGFTSLVTVFAAMKVGGLVLGLLKSSVDRATASFATHIVAAQAVTATHSRVAASALIASTAFRAMLGPLGFIATTIGVTMFSMRSFTNETQKMNDALDQARTQFDASAGAAEKTASQIISIEGATEGLRNRYDQLTGDTKLLELETQKVKSQFAEMGLKVDQNVSSVDDLIGMLHALRGELREKYIIQLETNLKDGELLTAQIENKLAGSRKGLLDVFSKAGGVRGATRGQAIPQHLEDATVVGVNPDSSFDAVSQTVVSMAKALEDEKAAFRAENGINSTFVKSDDHKLAEALLAELRKVLTDKAALDAAQMEVAKVERTQFNADQMGNDGPRGVQDRIEAMTSTTVGAALDTAGRDDAGKLLRDPIAVAERAQAVEAGFREEINQITRVIDQLVASNGLTEENATALRTKLGLAESTLDVAMGPIEEAAAKAEEETRKWAEAVSSRIVAGLERQMDKAETVDDVDSIAARVIEEVYKQNALAVADAGDDPVKLEAASRTLEDNLRGVRDSAEDRTQEIIDKTVEEIERLHARLEAGVTSFDDDLSKRMDKITDPDLINRITAQRSDAAYALLKDGLDVLEQIAAAGGENSQEDYDSLFNSFWDLIRGIQEDGDKALERITDVTDKAAADAQKLEIQALEETNAILAQQESNLLALADKALDVHKRNGLLEAAAAKNAEIAANTLKIIDKQFADGGGSGGGRERALALQRERQIATDRTYADRLAAPMRKSGGSKKKEDDPIQKFVEGAAARIQAMTIGMEAGVTDPTQGLAQFQKILDEAKVKVEEIGGQMGALQSRMLNGTLTAKEQEKLNTLVKQHVELTGFLKENEEDLLDLKVQQEGVLSNLTPLIQRWAEANLDMTKAAVSGIENILSGLKSSFGMLFKDLANGAKTGKEAFRDFGISVISSIQDVIAEMLAMFVIQQMVGMLPGGNFKTAAMSFLGSKEGGQVTAVKGMAAGGPVTGNLSRDSVTRSLMPDEYVLRRSAAQAIGKDELDKINGMGNTRPSEIGHKGIAKPSAPPPPPSNTNVWIVSPDQQPVMGPNDILAIVGEDISRGGSIKKMIKSVQNGAM